MTYHQQMVNQRRSIVGLLLFTLLELFQEVKGSTEATKCISPAGEVRSRLELTAYELTTLISIRVGAAVLNVNTSSTAAYLFFGCGEHHLEVSVAVALRLRRMGLRSRFSPARKIRVYNLSCLIRTYISNGDSLVDESFTYASSTLPYPPLFLIADRSMLLCLGQARKRY